MTLIKQMDRVLMLSEMTNENLVERRAFATALKEWQDLYCEETLFDFDYYCDVPSRKEIKRLMELLRQEMLKLEEMPF